MIGTQCERCKHIRRHADIDYCSAYPDGIPDAVFFAGHRDPKFGHATVRDDQEGDTVFEERELE